MVPLVVAVALSLFFFHLYRRRTLHRARRTQEREELERREGLAEREEAALLFQVPEKKHFTGCDEVDTKGQYPKVKQSLQQVFDCTYLQVALYLYGNSVPRDSQPLRDALQQEFDLVVHSVILAVNNLNVDGIILGWICILTQHLHDVKQTGRCKLFSSREEEMSVLREYSGVMVRKLSPPSLSGPNLNHCILQEIVAFKVLEVLVDFLSNPDTMNQLVVSQLGAESPATSTKPEGAQERIVHVQETEDQEPMTEDTKTMQTSDLKGKKKKTRLQRMKSKLKKIMKSKKDKGSDDEPDRMFRSCNASDVLGSDGCSGDDDDDGCSGDGDSDGSTGSISGSSSEDSAKQSPDSCADNILCLLSYEIWQISVWTASISQVEQQDKELLFTIHLEGKVETEALQWDTVKSQMDFKKLQSDLQAGNMNNQEGSSHLPSVAAVLENTERSIDDEFKEEAKATLNCFLQALLSDSEMRNKRDVFVFLCPLDQLLEERQREEPLSEIYKLLHTLASFFTDVEQEEEHSGEVERTPDGPKCQLGSGSGPPDSGEGGDGSTPGHHERLRAPLTEPNRAERQPAEMSKSTNSSGFEFRALPLPAGNMDQAPDQDTERIPQRLHRHVDQSQGRDCKSFPQDGKPTEKSKLPAKVPVVLPNRKEKGQRDPEQEKAPQHGKMDMSSKYTKALTDLLKEICDHSTVVKLCCSEFVQRLIQNTVKGYLKWLDFTEDQVASLISNIREKQWPEGVPEVLEQQETARDMSDMEKAELKEKAWGLIHAKRPMAMKFMKADLEKVFHSFQDAEQNKKLVYMLFSFLLLKMFPEERGLTDKAKALLKVPPLFDSV
ncbi:uncharacterized protein LOC108923212 isoform X1 [Scleropages formosus]|uniref:uncharacterized protein LOC108923212 isoform X1 n=1 Tax=Scleropages formosus TaxID=113540 RepID=UPI0010FA7A87|nr:uncharacterized protein LOC108923212 isoform X1 [Scleropages formosus]